MRLKYRDIKTDAEMKQFMAEIEAEDAAYASSYEYHQKNSVAPPEEEEWEDEMELLQRAGLDHRGLP